MAKNKKYEDSHFEEYFDSQKIVNIDIEQRYRPRQHKHRTNQLDNQRHKRLAQHHHQHSYDYYAQTAYHYIKHNIQNSISNNSTNGHTDRTYKKAENKIKKTAQTAHK